MKKLRHLSAAAFLTAMLAISTSAGEIQLGIAPPPPPAPPLATAPCDIGAPGDIYIPGPRSDLAIEVALSLLQDLLIMF
jgi:hypothetical protein